MDVKVLVVAAVLAVVTLSAFSFEIEADHVTERERKFSSKLSFLRLRHVGSEFVEKHNAYCLSGSIPSYHFRAGTSPNLLINFEAGETCTTKRACAKQYQTNMKGLEKEKRAKHVDGIFSTNSWTNPSFYDWSVLNIESCDYGYNSGSSVLTVSTPLGERTLYLNGHNVTRAIVEDVYDRYYKRIRNDGQPPLEQIVVSGCATGSISALRLAGSIQNWLTDLSATSHGPSRAPSLSILLDGLLQSALADDVVEVAHLHGLQCHGPERPEDCFHPRHLLASVSDFPVFLFQSAVDEFYMQNLDGYDSECPFKYRQCSRDIRNTILSTANDTVNMLETFKDVAHDSLSTFHTSCPRLCTLCASAFGASTMTDESGLSLSTVVSSWHTFISERQAQGKRLGATSYTDCAYDPSSYSVYDCLAERSCPA